MDLAEIRKKSQMERKTATDRGPEPPKSSAQPSKSPASKPAEVVIDLGDELPGAAVPPPPANPAPEPATIEEPLPLPELFPEAEGGFPLIRGERQRIDPLALILAGREMMGDDGPAVEETEEAAADDANFQEFLFFRIADEKYAVNIMEIKEIIKPREVTEVPRTPSFIAGVLSLRGVIIPVFDLALRLGLVRSVCAKKERIVVVKRGEGFCGILVDEVVQVLKLTDADFEPPPAVLDGIDRDFVTGIGRHDSHMLILLNIDKVLDINLC